MKPFRFALVWIVLFSCTDEPITRNFGYTYQPLFVGQSWTYAVTETVINQQVPTTRNYDLRILISKSITSDADLRSYQLTRYTRVSEAEEWQPIDTWSVSISLNQLIQNESNVNFVKLVFPLGPTISWNGNQYNNLPDNGNIFNGVGSEKYRLDKFEESFTLTTGLMFDKTITVVHNDFTDPIVGKDQRYEVYADEVGLVEKSISQLQYCTTPGCLGLQQIAEGYLYTQTLKSYAL